MNRTTAQPHATARPGFASVTAVILIALVGAALAAAVTLLGAESRRTRSAVEDAQLRQLLLAGEAGARQHLARRGAADGTAVPLALPADLSAAGARVELRFSPDEAGDSCEVRVDASLGRRRASQSLRFNRGNRGTEWQLVAAELNPPDGDS